MASKLVGIENRLPGKCEVMIVVFGNEEQPVQKT